MRLWKSSRRTRQMVHNAQYWLKSAPVTIRAPAMAPGPRIGFIMRLLPPSPERGSYTSPKSPFMINLHFIGNPGGAWKYAPLLQDAPRLHMTNSCHHRIARIRPCR